MSNKTTIPVVNLTSPDAAQKLLHAAVTYGFMYIEHNNALAISPEEVNSLFNLVRRDVDSFPARQG